MTLELFKEEIHKMTEKEKLTSVVFELSYIRKILEAVFIKTEEKGE